MSYIEDQAQCDGFGGVCSHWTTGAKAVLKIAKLAIAIGTPPLLGVKVSGEGQSYGQ